MHSFLNFALKVWFLVQFISLYGIRGCLRLHHEPTSNREEWFCQEISVQFVVTTQRAAGFELEVERAWLFEPELKPLNPSLTKAWASKFSKSGPIEFYSLRCIWHGWLKRVLKVESTAFFLERSSQAEEKTQALGFCRASLNCKLGLLSPSLDLRHLQVSNQIGKIRFFLFRAATSSFFWKTNNFVKK